MGLYIFFGKTGPQIDRRDYVKEKLEIFFGTKNGQDENTEIVCGCPPVELEVVEAAHLPSVSDAAQASLSSAGACFMKEVHSRWQARDGEKIIENLLTYSISTDKHIPPNTPVLRIKTNMGTVYYAKPDAVILGDVVQERDTLEIVPLVILSDLLLSFAKGIVSALGSKLVEELFGIGKTIDTRELCKQLAVIVKDANADQTVQEQSAQINAVQNYLTVYYKNTKTIDPKNRELLFGMLRQVLLQLENALQTLKQENFKRKGISVFIAGANIMLSLLQEMAFVTPGQMDHKKTASYQSYKDMLKQYIDFVKEMRVLVTSERIACVTSISCKNECFYAPPGEVYCTYHCRYKDSFAKQDYDFTNNKKGPSAHEQASDSRNQLIERLKPELNWMDEVAAHWKRALDNA